MTVPPEQGTPRALILPLTLSEAAWHEAGDLEDPSARMLFLRNELGAVAIPKDVVAVHPDVHSFEDGAKVADAARPLFALIQRANGDAGYVRVDNGDYGVNVLPRAYDKFGLPDPNEELVRRKAATEEDDRHHQTERAWLAGFQPLRIAINNAASTLRDFNLGNISEAAANDYITHLANIAETAHNNNTGANNILPDILFVFAGAALSKDRANNLANRALKYVDFTSQERDILTAAIKRLPKGNHSDLNHVKVKSGGDGSEASAALVQVEHSLAILQNSNCSSAALEALYAVGLGASLISENAIPMQYTRLTNHMRSQRGLRKN